MCLTLLLQSGLSIEAVEFVDPTADTTSEDGVVAFEWSGAPAVAEYELQQSRSADFSETQTRYQGADRGSVITGLAEGEYFFRVGNATTNTWSAPVRVEVKYMNMTLVWTLMGVGVFVFGATVTAILRGHYNQEDAS